MNFRDRLSLLKNGGVQYEGARVDLTAEEAVLFVGLGGTGVDALLRIKNAIRTRANLPQDCCGCPTGEYPPNFGFLALDADRAVLKARYGESMLREDRGEFIDLFVPNLPETLETVTKESMNSEIWSWLERDWEFHGGPGAFCGRRQIGRFMLFQHIDKICRKISETIGTLRQAATGNKLRIVVLTGIGGMVGSGTFLDIAYILRHLGQRTTPNVEVCGYILTPDTQRGRGGYDQGLYFGGFAALKELDYWMSAGEHGEPFIQRYSDNLYINDSDRPFDFCYLITAQEADNWEERYRGALELVSESLFSGIVSEGVLPQGGQSSVELLHHNVIMRTITMERLLPANYRYCSVGLSEIKIPYTEITTLIAARVFERLAPVFENTPTVEKFNANLFGLQMTANQLWSYIHKNVASDPVRGQGFIYPDIWPGNFPYRRAEQWIIQTEQAMRQNSANMVAEYDRIFRDYIDSLMKDPEFGPCYAARLVYSNTGRCLIREMEEVWRVCIARRATYAEHIAESEEKLNQAFERGQAAGILGRSRAAREYNEALEAWFENRYDYVAYNELVAGLQSLIKQLHKYYDKVFKPLQDLLCELPVIFRENMEKIRFDEMELRANPERAKRYLIRPLEFEEKYKEALAQQMNASSVAFLRSVAGNLRQWVGLELDDVDVDIMANTDIAGCIARFIDENFGMTLRMNMETLLLDRAPAGVDVKDYLRETLDDLKASAVPAYSVEMGLFDLCWMACSVVSVPNNCHETRKIAQRPDRPPEDILKVSAESSKLQWLKVAVGLPLYAFSEINEMERVYERGMRSGFETRRGMHLRREWREELPSPLPEATWPYHLFDTPQKAFSKAYNERVREAFDTCVAARIIRLASDGERAILYIADETILQRLDIHGTQAEKRKMADEAFALLWGNDATTIRMIPYGRTGDGDLMERVRENILRMPRIAQAVIRQADMLAQFKRLVVEANGTAADAEPPMD